MFTCLNTTLSQIQDVFSLLLSFEGFYCKFKWLILNVEVLIVVGGTVYLWAIFKA